MQTEEAIARLTQRLEDAERKAAIWRSQVIVVLLVTVLGSGATIVWTRAHLARRLDEVAARARKLEEAGTKKPKVVEAERFIVRDSTGTVQAVLGCGEGEDSGKNSSLSFYSGGVQRVRLGVGHLLLFRQDLNVGVALAANDTASGVHVNGLAGSSSVFSASVSKSGYGLFSAQPVGSGSVFDFSAIKAARTE